MRLIRPNGEVAEKLPTLREALDLFLSNKPVLIDMDKIDPGAGTTEQPKTYFFDAIYTIAKEKNILDRIIVKQRVDKFSATDLKASAVVDWKNWYFTPTVFSDYKDPNNTPLNDVLGSYFDDPLINCVGVEYIYLSDIDDVFANTYNYIKGKNKRVFQFPAYPENAAGVWNPKPFLFSDIDPSDDRRNDWNWLLQKERRPDVIISDRFEVLYDLLTTMGLRNKTKQ